MDKWDADSLWNNYQLPYLLEINVGNKVLLCMITDVNVAERIQIVDFSEFYMILIIVFPH